MILRQLSEAVGVSGKEEAVRAIILPAIAAHTTEVRIDPLGGISALKRGTGASPIRLMLAAHMDEIGFMVRSIDSDGLIRVSAVGGIDDRILPGTRVRLGAAGTIGVFVWTPIHQNHDQNAPKLKDMRIDIGASSRDEATGKVSPGDVGTFDSAYMEIGTRMLRGKAFDDRAGCALLIDTLANEGGDPYPVDLLAAFTVQEEIGLRGARVAAQRLDPDIALILESTTAHDVPNPALSPDEVGNENPTCRIGGGPVLSFMDRSMITQPRLFAFLRATAEAAGIPYQFKSQLGGGTDGGAVHIANAGIPTAVISLPCRYIHSPAAYLHRDDYDATLALIRAFIHHLPALDLRDPA
ncbi:MAG: M42 family metallopeptidase [Chloroflexota bacterium]|nr:M42 family metallopeptidase [Chloroflexota bacterium]